MQPTEADLKAAVDLQILADLVLANRILYALGVVDAYGHVSARDPKRPEHYFLSRALAPALVKVDDIMAYDLDSRPVEDRGCELYSERFIHGEVYRARPDVHAVVHSHSPTVIPFGISDVPLRPVTTLETIWRSNHFDLGDYRFTSAEREPALAGAAG